MGYSTNSQDYADNNNRQVLGNRLYQLHIPDINMSIYVLTREKPSNIGHGWYVLNITGSGTFSITPELAKEMSPVTKGQIMERVSKESARLRYKSTKNLIEDVVEHTEIPHPCEKMYSGATK